MKFEKPSLDLLRLAAGAVLAQRLRSALTILGIAIGISSVILLTSLGEGTRRAVVSEFSQFGTNVMAIHRGKVTTSGIPGSALGTVRKLTVDDSEALNRVEGVERVVPVAAGSARFQRGDRGRSVFVYGVTSEVPAVWKFRVRHGRFLPPGDPRRPVPLVVLGPKLKRELFGEENPLGERIRIAGRRFVVIGVMEPKGQFLGFDMDDCGYVPVASAQSLFNQDELVEIDLTFSPAVSVERLKDRIRSVLMRRHGGEEDFTMTTQTEALDILNRILDVVSFAVGGIGAISLVVGAIGILTILWIAVGERTPEIGLEKAVGASPGQILALFLFEAALLAGVGGIFGVGLGFGLAALLRMLVPALPLHTPMGYAVAAVVFAIGVGLASGVLPARRAARLDALEALRAE
jgi:putative ABC transport system permease protein